MERRLWIVPLILISSCCLPLVPTQAQIIPDATLPNRSRVKRDRTTRIITGGTQVGDNLFHSFQEFSIPNGATASFRDISPEVATIFSRVTGNSASRINGILEALQADGRLSSATVFLINPHGILFGRNAQLNLGGSFIASTADGIRFADGTEFSAVQPQRSPLLTVSTPIGLQIGQSPGPIRNQSRSNLVRDQFGDPIAGGLQVASGRTLALVGGDLEVAGGLLTAPGGQIELVSGVGERVALSSPTTGWRLGYGQLPKSGAIQFSDAATVNASGVRGGGIGLRANQVQVAGSTLIFSETSGAEAGADILIQAAELRLNDFSVIGTGTNGTGNGGSIRVVIDRLIAQAGGQISTRTSGAGNAGNLEITATETVSLSGERSVLNTGDFSPTGLFAQTAEASLGRGGQLTLTTPTLVMQSGASIATDTSGMGRAGTIQIQAETIDLAGVLLNPDETPVLEGNLPLPTGIFADSNASATGQGGAIRIDTERLHLRDGAVLQTNTEGVGDAGNLTIRAAEAIELIGMDRQNRTPSTIFAASGGLAGAEAGGTTTATGRGGRLSLRTPSLSLEEGAVIAVGSLNPANRAAGAGDLDIVAGRIFLNDRGRLVAESASGNGGNINLQIQEQVVLRDQSQISTSAGIEDRGGNGGNITIDTGFILAASNENSDIRANAFTGRGGNVTITAEGILGISPQPSPTGFSDITASSEFGTPGTVVIRSPDVDPTARAPELAATPLSDRPAQGCEIVQGNSTAEFFNTGRSGIAISPYEPLSSSDILVDLRLPSQDLDRLSATARLIIEAQKWRKDEQGAIVLMAEQPPPMYHCQFR